MIGERKFYLLYTATSNLSLSTLSTLPLPFSTLILFKISTWLSKVPSSKKHVRSTLFHVCREGYVITAKSLVRWVESKSKLLPYLTQFLSITDWRYLWGSYAKCLTLDLRLRSTEIGVSAVYRTHGVDKTSPPHWVWEKAWRIVLQSLNLSPSSEVGRHLDKFKR